MWLGECLHSMYEGLAFYKPCYGGAMAIGSSLK